MTRINPILICGVDRSGTTMLGSILGRSPGAICTPESNFLMHLCHSPDFDLERIPARETLRKIEASERFRLLWLDKLPKLQWPHRDDSTNYTTLIEELVLAYARASGRNNPTRWVDHPPSNARRAESMIELFPDARFVHIVRDPRAVVASLTRLPWGPSTPMTAANYWLQKIAAPLALETGPYKKRIIRTRYEDILASPAEELAKLRAFLRLPPPSTQSDAESYSVSEYQLAQHALVGRDPDPTRGKAWEQQLTQREVEIIEYCVADTLQVLGYAPRFGHSARPPTRRERVIERATRLCRRFSDGVAQRNRVSRNMKRT